MPESLGLLQHALFFTFKMSLALVMVASCASIAISLVLSAFQIQDQTLPFAIKLVAVSAALAMVARSMGIELLRIVDQVFLLISVAGR